MLRNGRQKLVRPLVYGQRQRLPSVQRQLAPLQGPLLGSISVAGTTIGFVPRSYCDPHAISNIRHESPLLELVAPARPSGWRHIRRQAGRAWRIFWRLLKLSLTLAPVAAFYPILLLMKEEDADLSKQEIILKGESKEPENFLLDWYMRLCLGCVEWSGAAVIKLMQWAGSRPDLFGARVCSVFSKLQDDTTPHKWRHTNRMMSEAYGDNWEDRIRLEEILGSGCIGQVYSGTVTKSDGSEEQVAVKVLHPSVENDIDADLDIMRLAVYLAEKLGLFPSLKWLNLPGVVEEFAGLLKLQLDLRQEAENLKRFNENFKDDESVCFPQLIPEFPSSRNVLVESYHDGIPVLQFARQNQHNRQLLHELCTIAIEAVCRMIFLDNFVHGDLHPGNVYVSRDGKKFILFDVGIVAEYAESDHETIIGVLGSFIRKRGRKAGRLMIDDSNSRLRGTSTSDAAVDEETFIDKIEALTIEASTKGYVMEKLGVYISYICKAASDHHIMLNPSFVSAALAVKVEEAIAIALDPSIPIWKVATPIIIKSESRRRASGMSQTMGIDRILSAIFGDRETKDDV